MANIVMFCILAVVILGSAVFCVITKSIMRAATFLLFVLFGVAGIYFLLDYTFLGAAQVSIYAGGITMIYIFAIQLVSKRTLQGLTERLRGSKVVPGCIVAVVGCVMVLFILLKQQFISQAIPQQRGAHGFGGQHAHGVGKISVCAPIRVHIGVPACLHHRWNSNFKKGQVT